MKNKPMPVMNVRLNNQKLSLKEITQDISAFLHFLQPQNHKGSVIEGCLRFIPKSLRVRWDNSAEGIYLTKDIHEREICIYTKPVESSFQEQYRMDLLMYFHSIIAEEQINTVTLLMSKLSEEDMQNLRNDFLVHKNSSSED